VRSLASESAAAIPALALAAYARPEDRIKALRAGFQVHLAKPVELIAIVPSLGRRVQGGAPGAALAFGSGFAAEKL
jgi:CheY-like chemotaxis protein